MQRTRCDVFRRDRFRSIVAAGLTCLGVAMLVASGCDAPTTRSPNSKASSAGLPQLVDLGARQCIPCKRMAPILEELRDEYAGSLEVVFIDVSQDAVAAKIYNVETIPVQIFLDASGTELFRHEGFFAKEDILAKWKELGFTLEEKRPAPAKGA